MKKTIIAALSVLAFIGTSFAQDGTRSSVDWSPEIYKKGKKYPGYIISLDGDTTKGFIKAGSRCAAGGLGWSNQNRAEFYLKESDKKPVDKYKPAELKGYKVADKEYESIAYSGGLLKKPNFNLIVKDGAIRMYEWYATVDNFATVRKQSGESWADFNARRYETNLIVAKKGEKPIEYGMLGLQFAKKMPPLVADNEEMASKISNKEKGYKMLNLFKVIDEYNAWAAANK